MARTDPTSSQTDESLVEVEDLQIRFYTGEGVVKAVNGVSFDIEPGETVGLVGESGAGKSVTGKSLLRLIEDPGQITGGAVRFQGSDVLEYSANELRNYRGSDVGMIFQDPESHLNPVFSVGEQIAEAVRLHQGVGRSEARKRAIDMLEQVGISNPVDRYDEYPHEFSGGMKQRVLIAIALSCDPDLLIADEPTTALDVSTEAQILRLISELSEEYNTAVLFITHDLGVVAEMCDRVLVMYAGKIVEDAGVWSLFNDPLHPYTEGLLNSIPAAAERGERLEPITGDVPSPQNLPHGCSFHPRCPYAIGECERHEPELYNEDGRSAACFKYDDEVFFDNE